MSKVAVLDTEQKVLDPCHPAVARRLLKAGKAAVYKRYPFTIILKRCVIELELRTSEYQLCIDPGSKVTGLAIVDSDRNIVFAAELEHRGQSNQEEPPDPCRLPSRSADSQSSLP